MDRQIHTFISQELMTEFEKAIESAKGDPLGHPAKLNKSSILRNAIISFIKKERKKVKQKS